jgi:hypothetical protein
VGGWVKLFKRYRARPLVAHDVSNAQKYVALLDVVPSSRVVKNTRILDVVRCIATRTTRLLDGLKPSLNIHIY